MAAVSTIMIVGAGQMGTMLAHLALEAGLVVYLHDIEEEHTSSSIAHIRTSLLRENAQQEKIAELLSSLHPSHSLQDGVHADLVLETATENLAIKHQIFATLSNYITQETVLATNSSSISINELAASTECPEQFIGLHFINPLPAMPLVEIIKGHHTSGATVTTALSFVQRLGRQPIEVNDHPGFVSNRLLMPLINEAITCVFDGVADAETVDRVMQLGMQQPLGPLHLADLIGLDTCLTIMENLHRELEENKYRPCPLLRTMVKAGKLGKKSGQGFFTYPVISGKVQDHTVN